MTAARKGVERRDLEVRLLYCFLLTKARTTRCGCSTYLFAYQVRLLYSFLVTIATYQGAAAPLTTPTTPGAAAVLLLSTYYSSYYSRCGCSTYYSS